jgi:hypothetical protein
VTSQAGFVSRFLEQRSACRLQAAKDELARRMRGHLAKITIETSSIIGTRKALGYLCKNEIRICSSKGEK